MSFTPLRWGICAAGRISHDFVTALKTKGLPAYGNNVAHAVAARSADRAREFGRVHGIARCYGSYEELAHDPEVDIVYVASITSEHYAHTKLMLENNKHVLCEKTMMTSKQQTEDVIALAREKKLFLMETEKHYNYLTLNGRSRSIQGDRAIDPQAPKTLNSEAMWTRFFPATRKLKELLVERAVGDVLLLTTCFSMPNANVERIYNPKLGGGCMFDLLIYCIQLACFVFDSAPIKVVGLGSLFSSGADESCVAVLEFEGSRFAEISSDSRVQQRNDAVIYGTRGMIEIASPSHAPTKMVVKGTETLEYPLPPPSASPAGFEFENSAGLSYEAEAVRECLQQGKIEHPWITHKESLAFIQIIDELRTQLQSSP